ncbi:MAG TPA: tetratricopeptide repeat protein [Cyclobacteriaceae bacterium]|nr:tetratricopeptide repeat protein [Cyclobacteriaceae bacterium]HRW98892.1 tetratricopeptide repeat protein [Cyclobacteriaceae bacterium]
MNIERIKLLEEYIKDDPGEPFNHYALALEFMQEDQDKAVTILLKLIKEHPDYIPSYYHAANLLLEQNRLEEAKIVAERGIQICRKKNEHKAANELKSLYDEMD